MLRRKDWLLRNASLVGIRIQVKMKASSGMLEGQAGMCIIRRD
jgi:hypothetical protein